MTDMSAAQSAQQNNRDGSGRYATKTLGESGVDIDSETSAEDRYAAMSKTLRQLEIERHDVIVGALRERVRELHPDARYLMIWKTDDDGYYPGAALAEWCDDVANTDDDPNDDALIRRWVNRIDPYDYSVFAKHLADEEMTDRAVEAARLDFMGYTAHAIDLGPVP